MSLVTDRAVCWDTHMSVIRVFVASLLLSGAAWADDGASVSVGAPTVIGEAVSTSAVLPAVSLPHNSRLVVLIVGVGAVLVTFQRALTTRRKSA